MGRFVCTTVDQNNSFQISILYVMFNYRGLDAKAKPLCLCDLGSKSVDDTSGQNLGWFSFLLPEFSSDTVVLLTQQSQQQNIFNQAVKPELSPFTYLYNLSYYNLANLYYLHLGGLQPIS